MPTLHRLSCFRDDLIFFIYLYQVRISIACHDFDLDLDLDHRSNIIPESCCDSEIWHQMTSIDLTDTVTSFRIENFVDRLCCILPSNYFCDEHQLLQHTYLIQLYL